jgi:hypothetical protein
MSARCGIFRAKTRTAGSAASATLVHSQILGGLLLLSAP